jgi:hypothetical protein
MGYFLTREKWGYKFWGAFSPITPWKSEKFGVTPAI